MHRYRKKAIWFLLGYLILFLLVFVWGMYNLVKGTKIVSIIGLNANTINWIVVVGSVLAMIKVVWEIAKTERHHEFEARVKVY